VQRRRLLRVTPRAKKIHHLRNLFGHTLDATLMTPFDTDGHERAAEEDGDGLISNSGRARTQCDKRSSFRPLP